MNPLIDASLIKLKAQLAEQMKVEAQLFPRYQITNNITVEVPQPLLDEARAAEGKGLPLPEFSPESDAASATEPTSTASEPPSLVLPRRIGVVKAWDFIGTRLQVEFTVLNDTDRLIAIRDVMMLIGGVEIPDPQVSGYVPDAVHFKQFVDVTPDVRLPSRRRLPVVVRARCGVWLCAELETPEDVNFGSREHHCALWVSLSVGTNIRCRFQVHGDALWASLITQMQETAVQEKSAASLGLPMTPIDEAPS